LYLSDGEEIICSTLLSALAGAQDALVWQVSEKLAAVSLLCFHIFCMSILHQSGMDFELLGIDYSVYLPLSIYIPHD
jgi:hypothetical protein